MSTSRLQRLAVALLLVTDLGLSSAGASGRRIVTVGGAVTEIVVGLGLGDKIAAVDTTSTFPEALTSRLPKVGYMRQLSAEGVISLAPSHVLAIEGSGPADALTLIREAGVSLTTIPEVFSPGGISDKIRRIGTEIGAADAAGRLAGDTTRRFATLSAGNAAIKAPLRVLFALSFLNGKLTASGTDTAADAAIRLSGAVNAVEGFAGYKPLTEEAIIAARPDAILVMDRAGQKPEDVLAHPALSQTPAAVARRFVVMDGMYLLGFGPRAPQAFAELRGRLYPGIAFPPLDPAP
jgi:iron complex transport system substrate-binding protein